MGLNVQYVSFQENSLRQGKAGVHDGGQIFGRSVFRGTSPTPGLQGGFGGPEADKYNT